jgi:hypothetical protein
MDFLVAGKLSQRERREREKKRREKVYYSDYLVSSSFFPPFVYDLIERGGRGEKTFAVVMENKCLLATA